MPENDCVYCKDFPGTAIYLAWTIIPCVCGNFIKRKELPAIYVGQTNDVHVYVIAFPGCNACGRPANLPWTIMIKCANEGQIKLRFEEVYHNYGLRN